ncbi:D-alanyl-D-alanine carboxypeptidase family protein [Alkaliphilus serpentinus]|uniref:serine-type D-Ala-D-Ala carboxypeptidase n=1 Tax=Alkaliphilus serpentinus TaxID=1482731 RepID=A0A833HMC5_9FIRM|nr:D-alanyl-D-alanine carboxypeptidase family protein [Alkaliphilus serpentinus]KAB3527360.1 D-alanyl-D-alanine carboxypeptidase [Alkaliphilus serpentinus]
MKKNILIVALIVVLILPLTIKGEEISVSGRAAIVMDVATGRVLYEKNIHDKMPMASTTKIMTALLAIENTDLDHTVKVTPEAVGIEGSSIYLQYNEEIKMKDLLYGLMLRSGNDAAAAIAIELGESIEGFSKLMNKRAEDLGAKNTNFVNPHGLHHENHYTTAHDLSLITRAALKEQVFKEIVSTRYYLADRDTYKHFANKNRLLSMCEGGDGVKTGYTRRSGRCLVASASRDNMQLIAVTLNDPNWFNTTKDLLDKSFEEYHGHIAFEKGELVEVIPVFEGKVGEVQLVSSKEVVIPLLEGEEENLRTIVDVPNYIEAPVLKGTKIGKLYTYLDDQLLAEADIIANADIDKLTLKDKIKRFFKID